MTVSPPDIHHVELFMSIFRGRSDVYARRWDKDGQSGYSPAYEFDWDEFLAHKRRGGSLKDFKNKRLRPLTQDVIRKHLLGADVIGIYPILPDNMSYFLAADFDGEHWQKEAIAFINAAAQMKLTAHLERSRSGDGGHAWIFFSEPYPCYKSRQIGFHLIRRAFNFSEFDKEISFDRLFPSQDALSKAGFGNLIALPLQGKSMPYGNTVFLDRETGTPFANQWMFLDGVKRHCAREMDVAREELSMMKAITSAPSVPRGRPLSIHVANQITLLRSELSPDVIALLKEELNFLNTEYLTKRRLGKSTYKVQKYFKLIEESNDAVLIPRGFLKTLLAFLNKQAVGYSVQHHYPGVKEVHFKSCLELRPFQRDIVDSALEHDQGVIVSPAGSGKTIVGLELIARRQLPALILVHRKQIFDQWVERIQEFLGIPKAHIGQYSGIKKMIGSQITVGLLQSLGRKTDFSDFHDRFGTIIVDECHHIPASTFRAVVSQLNSHYLYGLTATPKRKHNDEKLIFVYIGDVIANLQEGEIRPVPSTLVPPVMQVIVRETKLFIPFVFTTDLFQLLAKVICFDTARNMLITDDILRQTSGGKRVLVLSERKEHLEILNLYLKGKCETIVISGDDSPSARRSKSKQIEGGHYQAILSTGQFFGEGVDLRGITCLILAFPFSFEGKLTQYIGRLRDTGAQKLVIEYRDRSIPFLERQYKQRERYYRKTSALFTSE